MVEEAVAMVEEVAAMGEEGAALVVAVAILVVAAAISVVAAAILLGLRGIVLPAIVSHKTKERTLRGTKVISGTEIISGTSDIFLLEIPFGMITHTTGMTIRTTVIMTTMPATIPMDNPHQPK